MVIDPCFLRFLELNHFCAHPQFVQVVCPIVHHPAPLFHEFGAVIRSPQRSRFTVRQLGFDHIGGYAGCAFH